MTLAPPSAEVPAVPGRPGAPRLSVVVTIVDGERALRECLDALAGQRSAPSMEVIVPFDASVPWVEGIAAGLPSVRFLAMGDVRTERPVASPAGQHELYDRRRAVGLAAARGDVVAILEDRGVPEAGWAAGVVRLHDELPHAVIGGAVECGVDALLSWAVYFCDFSRYQLPLVAGPRAWVTDVNISYKRAALERVRTLWERRYHETTVHWRLARDGETLFLTPALVVWQRRQGLRLGALLRERVEWGRLFAYTRAVELGRSRRVALAAMTPVLPVLLLARHTRTQVAKRVRLTRFLMASPAVALLLVAWSLGEAVGYVTGRP